MKRYVITAVGVLVVMVGVCVYLLVFFEAPGEKGQLNANYVLQQIEEVEGNAVLFAGWSNKVVLRDYAIKAESSGKLSVQYVGVYHNPDDNFYGSADAVIDFKSYSISADKVIKLTLHFDPIENIASKAVITVSDGSLEFVYYYGEEKVYTAVYAKEQQITV